MTTTNNNVNEEERNTSDSPVVEALAEYFKLAGYITGSRNTLNDSVPGNRTATAIEIQRGRY